MLPWKHLSFERGFNNHVMNSIIAVKVRSRQIKNSRYWEAAAAERHPGILRFHQNLWKIIVKEFIFANQCCRIYASSFTRKTILSQTFLKDFTYKLSWQNYRIAASKKFFQSKHSVAASFYANNFLIARKGPAVEFFFVEVIALWLKVAFNAFTT